MSRQEYRIDWRAVVIGLDGTQRAISKRTGVDVQLISRIRTGRMTTPRYPDGLNLLKDYGTDREIPLRY